VRSQRSNPQLGKWLITSLLTKTIQLDHPSLDQPNGQPPDPHISAHMRYLGTGD